MTGARRVGAETSTTRRLLLDTAERLMVRSGYAAVTYRRVATAAGVTSGLVQYYFPSIDDLFVAMIERRGGETHDRFLAALAARPDDPLHVIWESAADNVGATLTIEFTALANHRKEIRARIRKVTERTRRAQLEALQDRWHELESSAGGLSPEGFLFLLHAVAKMAALENSIGLTIGHDEVLAQVEQRLDGGAGTRKTSKNGRRKRSSPR